jgi:hypothetical protein
MWIIFQLSILARKNEQQEAAGETDVMREVLLRMVKAPEVVARELFGVGANGSKA